MKVQYLIDGIEISRDIFYNSNKGIAKKIITLNSGLDFNKLKAHLKDELQYVSEKCGEQKSPEQESPKQEYPKPPGDSFNENNK